MDRSQGQDQPRREDELGALWLKSAKSGGDYFTGSITVGGEKIDIVVFSNRFKKSDKQPDYRILRARERSEREAASRRYEGFPVAPQAVGDDDAIPF